MDEGLSSSKKPSLPKELTTVTRVSKALALFMFIALPVIGFLMGRNYQLNLDNSLSYSRQVSIIQNRNKMTNNKPVFPDIKGTYVKRQYKPTDKLLENFSYPAEMNSIPDNNIQSMKCTDFYDYAKDYGDTTYTYKNDDRSKPILTDKNIEKLFDYYRKTYIANVYVSSTFQYCQTINGDRIIRYNGEKPNDPSNEPNKYKITYELITAAGISKKAFTTYHTAPDLFCRKILLLTTNNKLYVECSNGDVTIYKIIYLLDFNTGEAKELYECIDTGNGGVSTITPKISCSYK